jgi:hypothetical protein
LSVSDDGFSVDVEDAELDSPSDCDLDLSSSATEPILRATPLGGESERVFFVFFTLRRRKRAKDLPYLRLVGKILQPCAPFSQRIDSLVP